MQRNVDKIDQFPNVSYVSNNASIFQDHQIQQNPPRRRFNKGLKMLSVIVKDIVIQRQSTTYKEVADIILKDSIKYDNVNINSQ